jgi:hypothetical protein
MWLENILIAIVALKISQLCFVFSPSSFRAVHILLFHFWAPFLPWTYVLPFFSLSFRIAIIPSLHWYFITLHILPFFSVPVTDHSLLFFKHWESYAQLFNFSPCSPLVLLSLPTLWLVMQLIYCPQSILLFLHRSRPYLTMYILPLTVDRIIWVC